MKTYLNPYSLYLSGIFLILSFPGSAQEYPDAKASDPDRMGWMQGFPPPPEKIISATDGSFFHFPALRYSVCHMREFLPTTVVKAQANNISPFHYMLDTAIDTLIFLPAGSQDPMSWKESLAKNYTDGIIILHNGSIVYEAYFGALKPEGLHAAMSVSKTFTGTLGALLLEEGVLEEGKTGAYYVPELEGSAFGEATIRQLLDMTTNIQYSEDYTDPNAEVWTFTAAGNPFPKPADYIGPENYYEYLATVKAAGNHGDRFAYKTVNTDALGWIISRATGKSIPDLLSERIWKPLGAAYDGYFQVDGAGIAFAGGGFNANLRDLARFGEMIRLGGKFNDKLILPPALVEDLKRGGDKKAFKRSQYSALEGWSYRNMWWITHNEHGAFAARGVHGQTIYIDPMAKMVLVRFASHPEAKNAKIDPTSLPAYHAVAKYLMTK